MTFLLALFIALAKRRDDVLIYNKTGKRMRRSLSGYNLKFIDQSMGIMAAVIIVAYIQYTTSFEVIGRVGAKPLYLTVLFVIIGIMRYIQITVVEEKSGSPVQIALKDKPILLNLVCWIISFYFILYG